MLGPVIKPRLQGVFSVYAKTDVVNQFVFCSLDSHTAIVYDLSTNDLENKENLKRVNVSA